MSQPGLDLMATYRHDIRDLVRVSPHHNLNSSDDDDSPPAPSHFVPPSISPSPPAHRSLSDDEVSESDDEMNAQLAQVAAAVSAFNAEPQGQTFVGRERTNALADADEDEYVICEETPIIPDYDRNLVPQGSSAFWVLEYELAMIGQESIVEKRGIRAKIRNEIVTKAHADRMTEIRTKSEQEIVDQKKAIRAEIERLQKQLVGLTGETRAALLASITGSFSGGIIPREAKAAKRRDLDEDEEGEERLAQLDLLIEKRKAETEQMLNAMTKEVNAFGAHLAAEGKAIAALQRRKRLETRLVLPEQANSPEAVNALVAQIESAYEGLY